MSFGNFLKHSDLVFVVVFVGSQLVENNKGKKDKERNAGGFNTDIFFFFFFLFILFFG